MKSILLAPEDMSTATLLADATQTKIKFEWDASGIGNDTECTVLLSLDPEMDNFVAADQRNRKYIDHPRRNGTDNRKTVYQALPDQYYLLECT